MPVLKNICAEHKLMLTGNKPLLMARVWGILHPAEAPKEVRKKRGRKPKTPKPPSSFDTKNESESSNVVDDTECELDPDKMPSIYVNVTTGETSWDKLEHPAFKSFKVIKDTPFVFQEGEVEFEYVGKLNDSKNHMEFSKEIPEDFLKLLGM